MQRELFGIYIRFAGKMLKLYGPAAAIELASLFTLFKYGDIYKERSILNASVALALGETIKEVKERLDKKYGTEEANKIMYGIEDVTTTEEITDENGEKKTVEKTERKIVSHYNPYVRIFQEGCRGYDNDHDLVMNYLKIKESQWNDELKARRKVMLNQVLHDLGYPETREGQTHGWKYDPKNKNLQNNVSFGIFEVDDPDKQDFIKYRQDRLILHFNCDGDIMDLVWPEKETTYIVPEEEERCAFDVR